VSLDFTDLIEPLLMGLFDGILGATLNCAWLTLFAGFSSSTSAFHRALSFIDESGRNLVSSMLLDDEGAKLEEWLERPLSSTTECKLWKLPRLMILALLILLRSS
jgi:hypothetical protein